MTQISVNVPDISTINARADYLEQVAQQIRDGSLSGVGDRGYHWRASTIVGADIADGGFAQEFHAYDGTVVKFADRTVVIIRPSGDTLHSRTEGGTHYLEVEHRSDT